MSYHHKIIQRGMINSSEKKTSWRHRASDASHNRNRLAEARSLNTQLMQRTRALSAGGLSNPTGRLSAQSRKALAFLFALESWGEQDVAGMRPVRRNGENTVETLWKEKGVILNDSIPCQTKTGESGERGNALIASEFVDFKGVASHEASRVLQVSDLPAAAFSEGRWGLVVFPKVPLGSNPEGCQTVALNLQRPSPKASKGRGTEGAGFRGAGG